MQHATHVHTSDFTQFASRAGIRTHLSTLKPMMIRTVTARQMRVIPPYSLGNVLNAQLIAAAPALLQRLA